MSTPFESLGSNSPYVLCKVSFLQPGWLHWWEQDGGDFRGGQEVVSVCQQRNQTQVCFHCLNSSICLSPLCFPGRGWHRNPSKAFYQAFQSGSRLRDSKAHSDRYGTILDWAGWACKSATTCVQCSAATSFAPPPPSPAPPSRAWTEFENKAWQPVQDWPIGFLTSSVSVCNFL